jgi:hypothetical protein
VERLLLVVHVADYVGLRPVDRRATQRVVEHAFDRIGVVIEWRVDNGVPGGSLGVRHATVVLLNEAMQAAKLAKASLPDGVLGTAVDRAARIYVFYPRVERTAAAAVVPVGVPLGQVLTHELGHLLLIDGHDELGIMRQQLPRQGIASFEQFTAEQGSRIRQVLRPVAPGQSPSLAASRQAP